MSKYALQLVNAFNTTPFSLQYLRDMLYTKGFRKQFELIFHQDASFVEVTTRHL